MASPENTGRNDSAEATASAENLFQLPFFQAMTSKFRKLFGGTLKNPNAIQALQSALTESEGDKIDAARSLLAEVEKELHVEDCPEVAETLDILDEIQRQVDSDATEEERNAAAMLQLEAVMQQAQNLKVAGFTRGKTIKKEEPSVGRNQLCPCGSGKKFKKCCMGKQPEEKQEATE